MCIPGLDPITLGLIASGAGLVNNQVAANKRDKEVARGIREQGAHRRRAANEVTQQLGEREAATPDVAGVKDGLMGQLRRNLPQTGAAPQVGGRAYVERSAAADASVGDFGSQLAGVFARTDSAQRQRVGEDRSLARTGARVGNIQADASGDAAVSDLRARSIRPNPWVGALAQFGQNLAVSQAGRPAVDPTGDAANMAQWARVLDHGALPGRPRLQDPSMNPAQSPWGNA